MPGPPAETPYRFMSLLGFVSSGDLGPITCYRSKLGKIVVFSKTWPKHPPTMAQLTGRARMSFGAEQWRGFNETYKEAWRSAARKANLNQTGYNLWIVWWMNKREGEARAINDLGYGSLMDQIQHTKPAWPANPKIQVDVLSDLPTDGVARYGRAHIWAPPGVTVWMTFLAFHFFWPIEEPFHGYFSVYGPGTITHGPVLNGRWFWLGFTTEPGATESEIIFHVEFPDGTWDETSTQIHTRIWP